MANGKNWKARGLPDFSGLYNVFNPPKPQKTLESGGPGVGPAAYDATATPPTPGFLGGSAIPIPDKPNATGYGGQSDSVTIVKSPIPPPSHIFGRGVPQSPARIPFAKKPLRPTYNLLYDSLNTRDAWKEVAENYAVGTFTQPTGTATTATPVTLTQNPNLHLSRYPGAISVYPVICFFGIAPQVTTATGAQYFIFQPVGGFPIALGISAANGVLNTSPNFIVDSPLTDIGNQTMGQLLCVGSGLATPGTLQFVIGFGWAYLLPDSLMHGYDYDIEKQLPPASSGEPREAILRRSS